MQPGTLYYLLLYLFIFVLRFFKIYTQVKDKHDEFNWRYYFFISLEIVYTSGGLVILLLASLPALIGVIMMTYVLLLIVSSYLDTVGQRFNDTARLLAHLGIIAIVVVSTIHSFENILPSDVVSAPKTSQVPVGKSKKETDTEAPKIYKVALPYIDHTLARHVGKRLGDRVLVYVASVTDTSKDAVIKHIQDDFWKDSFVRPFNINVQKNIYSLTPIENKAVVELVE